MKFSNDILKRIIDVRTVEEFYPYTGESFAEIGNEVDYFIKQVVNQFKNSKVITIETEFDHYGSGFASYVDVFITKKDGSSIKEIDDITWIQGVSLYLCRLAPVAVFGKNEKTKDKNGGGSFGFLREDNVGTTPEGNWEEIIDEVTNVLKQNQIQLLNRDLIMKPLEFEIEIHTILKDSNYNIFDVLFYWED